MNYKNKYLKYKLKYLNLKGGSNYEDKDDDFLDKRTEQLVLNEQDIKFEEQILGTELLYSLPENLYNFLSFVSTPFSRLFGFPPEQTSDFPLGDVTDDVIELENRRQGQLPRLVGELPSDTGQENEYPN
jgi:hypothetical protein